MGASAVGEAADGGEDLGIPLDGEAVIVEGGVEVEAEGIEALGGGWERGVGGGTLIAEPVGEEVAEDAGAVAVVDLGLHAGLAVFGDDLTGAEEDGGGVGGFGFEERREERGELGG